MNHHQHEAAAHHAGSRIAQHHSTRHSSTAPCYAIIIRTLFGNQTFNELSKMEILLAIFSWERQPPVLYFEQQRTFVQRNKSHWFLTSGVIVPLRDAGIQLPLFIFQKEKHVIVKTELIAFRTEPQLADQLRQAAVKHDRPQSWLIRKALESFLQKENKSVVSQPGSLDNAFVGTN